MVDILKMKQEHKEYFLSKVVRETVEIHHILGLRAQESLLSNIRAEQLAYTHQWELPNVSIQRNSCNKEQTAKSAYDQQIDDGQHSC